MPRLMGTVMNAKVWFGDAVDAEAKANAAKSTAERQRHGRNAIDAMLAAASLGHPDALVWVGNSYAHGAFGIIRARLDLAEHWLRLAAARSAKGKCELGNLLWRTGRMKEGHRWLRAALAGGEGIAGWHLGMYFEHRSPTRALRLFLKGAALGSPIAAVFAGRLLESRGSRKALFQAESLYQQAAKVDFPKAEDDLGRVRRKLSRHVPR